MKILCATDLLPKSEFAIERAGLVAEQLDADLSILHVVVPSESGQTLEQDLQHASALLKSRARPPLWRVGPSPNVLVRAGSPERILNQAARQADADLIVLGTHGKRPARDALAGTIAACVLSEHQRPVLIVKRMPKGNYRNVLLALDRSASSVAALLAAEALILRDGARATVVHAFEPPYEQISISAGISTNAVSLYAEAWKREALRVLRGLLDGASNDFSRYELVLEEARPATAVRKVAVRMQPDLLVMGTRGDGGFRRAVLGSVANRVLAHASTDVLIVPDGSERATTTGTSRLDRDSIGVTTGAQGAGAARV
jgi:nucleotide-binding universal stress UspA family protein